jgi:hypothetical protein
MRWRDNLFLGKVRSSPENVRLKHSVSLSPARYLCPEHEALEAMASSGSSSKNISGNSNPASPLGSPSGNSGNTGTTTIAGNSRDAFLHQRTRLLASIKKKALEANVKVGT